MNRSKLNFNTSAEDFPVLWVAGEEASFSKALKALVNKNVYLALSDIVANGAPLGGSNDAGSATITVVLDDAGDIMQVLNVEEVFMEEDNTIPSEAYANLATSFQRLADHFQKLTGEQS